MDPTTNPGAALALRVGGASQMFSMGELKRQASADVTVATLASKTAPTPAMTPGQGRITDGHY